MGLRGDDGTGKQLTYCVDEDRNVSGLLMPLLQSFKKGLDERLIVCVRLVICIVGDPRLQPSEHSTHEMEYDMGLLGKSLDLIELLVGPDDRLHAKL